MSIIVYPPSFPIIELRPYLVNYDQSVEEMIAGLPHNDCITSKRFPNCRGDKTGLKEIRAYLVKPTFLLISTCLQLLNKNNFIPEDLPALAPLKEYAEEFYGSSIYSIVTLGANSIWQTPNTLCTTNRYAICLKSHPDFRGFHLRNLEDNWHSSDNWFLVRRKTAEELQTSTQGR